MATKTKITRSSSWIFSKHERYSPLGAGANAEAEATSATRTDPLNIIVKEKKGKGYWDAFPCLCAQ
jgi:hypothetical protein